MNSTTSSTRRDETALSLGPTLSRIRHSFSAAVPVCSPPRADSNRLSESNSFSSWSHSLNRLERNISRIMNRHSMSSRNLPTPNNESQHNPLMEIPWNNSNLLRRSTTTRTSARLSRRTAAAESRANPNLNFSGVRPLSNIYHSGGNRSSVDQAISNGSLSSTELPITQSRSSLANPFPQAMADELPSYSRRAPLIRPFSYAGCSSEQDSRAPRRASHIPGRGRLNDTPESHLKPHIITSTSGKIQLTLFSPGHSRYPVLVQDLDQELRGELKLNLGEIAESFSEIRIKCKGVARTLVVRNQASGGNLINDEVVFMQHDQSLYQPSILTSGESKLSGTVKFPFRFQISPNRLVRGSLPPTFSLTSAAPDSVSANFGLAVSQKVTEWASVKYYVKVTLARRGILRSNERLFAPFVLLSKQTQPPIRSLTRLAAVNLGLPIPNPSEDPDGWMGRKIRQHIKLNGCGPGRISKSAWYEVMVLLPSPLCFARNKPLQYYLKFISSNPALTTEFNDSTFKVSLFQRASLTAVGVNGTHENTLSKGYSRPEGPNNGICSLSTPEEPWSRRYQGEIPLGNNAVPNFSCPNISIQYYFTVSVSVPGQLTDLQISLPIQLVSVPGRATPIENLMEDPLDFRPPLAIDFESQRQFNTAPTPRPNRPRNLLTNIEGELPPSYWDVQQMDCRRRPSVT